MRENKNGRAYKELDACPVLLQRSGERVEIV
jgi:hypothetical protein